MKTAAASGDIKQIIALIVSTSELTSDDFIQKTVGPTRFLYYHYCKEFQGRPRDMDDFIDGLLYLMDINYIRKQEYNKAKKQIDSETLGG